MGPQPLGNNIWVCGAHIKSLGRIIAWEIEEVTAKNILKSWENLIPIDDPSTPSHTTDYMGCYLSSQSKQKWFGYKGIINYSERNVIKKSKLNIDRMFEIYVLSTAPEDAIPLKILKDEFELN